MRKSTTPEYSILGTTIQPVAQVLRARGIDPAQLLQEVGIDITNLDRPGWRLSARLYNQMIHRCIEQTGDEAFGLYAAERLQPQVLRSLGLGWLASDTVYDGLRRLVRFNKLVSSISELSLEEDGELVRLNITGGGSAQLDNYEYADRDFGIGIIVRMCRLNMGDFLSPVRIEMERPTPNNPALWESMLATHVSFDCDNTVIIWSRPDIQRRLVTGDPALARILDEHAANYIDSFLHSSVSKVVAQKIINRLPDGPPSQKQIADDMCMGYRTLQRKLKEEGSSFKSLLQDSRIQLAKKYLRQSTRPTIETCYLLGFTEPSAFSRAFKRWTGETPKQYRDSNHND